MADEIRLTRFLYVDGADTDTKLRTPIIATGITVIGKNAFENDKTVEKLILPLTITCLEEKALKNCRELQVVEFNEILTNKKNHFLVEKIQFEKNTKEVQENSSEGCAKFQSIEFDYTSESQNCYYVTEPCECENTEALILQYQSFKDCAKLHTVIFAEKYKEIIIEKEAFAGCTSLRTIVCPFPEEVKVRIADDAFYALDNVVFVTKNEDVERFAREHEFHCVKGKLNE